MADASSFDINNNSSLHNNYTLYTQGYEGDIYNRSGYVGDIYNQTDIVTWWHNSWRAGYTNDISYVTRENTTYIQGAIVIGMLLLGFLVLWSGLLLLLKFFNVCCFLSGWRFEKSFDNCAAKIGRGTFICCAILIYIYIIVYVEVGLKSIENAKKLIISQNIRIKEVVEELDSVINTMLRHGTDALRLKKGVEKDIPYLCPYRNNTNLGQDFLNMLNYEYLATLDILGDFNVEKLWKPAKVWNLMIWDFTLRLDEDIEWYNVKLEVLYWFPLVVLTTILVIATVVAIYDNDEEDFKKYVNSGARFQWWLKKVVLPIFIIWNFITVFLAGATAFGTSINADLCAGGPYPGSPDLAIEQMFARNGYSSDSGPYKMFELLALRCRKNSRLPAFDRYSANLTKALDDTEYIMDYILDKGTIELSQDCRNDVTGILVAVDRLGTQMQYLNNGVQRATEALRCERFNSIYTELVYEGFCNHTAYGFHWMFWSHVAIAVLSMIMITLRSSILPSDDYTSSDEIEKDESTVDRYLDDSSVDCDPLMSLPPSETATGQIKQRPSRIDEEYEEDSYDLGEQSSSDADDASEHYDAQTNSEQLPLQQRLQNM